MKKRNILSLALVICLIAIMACGSLAYFTDKESVTNVFQTSFDDAKDKDGEGDIDDDDIKDSIFSIVVYETDNTKTDGSVTYDGNTYDEILPGITYDKDPTVKNTGSYDAFIRVHVTVNKAEEWTKAIAKHMEQLDTDKDGKYDLTGICGDFDKNMWTRFGEEPEVVKVTEKDPETGKDVVVDTTLTYTFYLNEELAVDKTATLFKDVTIPACFDVDDMLALREFNLEITADAIQSMNTGSPEGVDELDSYYAFQNFWSVNNPETTEPVQP